MGLGSAIASLGSSAWAFVKDKVFSPQQGARKRRVPTAAHDAGSPARKRPNRMLPTSDTSPYADRAARQHVLPLKARAALPDPEVLASELRSPPRSAMRRAGDTGDSSAQDQDAAEFVDLVNDENSEPPSYTRLHPAPRTSYHAKKSSSSSGGSGSSSRRSAGDPSMPPPPLPSTTRRHQQQQRRRQQQQQTEAQPAATTESAPFQPPQQQQMQQVMPPYAPQSASSFQQFLEWQHFQSYMYYMMTYGGGLAGTGGTGGAPGGAQGGYPGHAPQTPFQWWAPQPAPTPAPTPMPQQEQEEQDGHARAAEVVDLDQDHDGDVLTKMLGRRLSAVSARSSSSRHSVSPGRGKASMGARKKKRSRVAEHDDELQRIRQQMELETRQHQAKLAPVLKGIAEMQEVKAKLARQQMERDEALKRRMAAARRPAMMEVPAVTRKEHKRIQAVLAQDDSAVVADVEGIEVFAADMATLVNGRWLNDQIMDVYSKMVLAHVRAHAADFPRAPKVAFLGCYFLRELAFNKKGYNYQAVRRWTIRKKIDLFDLDKTEVLLVPVNLAESHWACAAVNFKEKRFEYYDSLGGSGSSQLVFSTLKRYLNDESNNKKKTEFDTSDWGTHVPQDIPHQKNGFDCGVFSLRYFTSLARGEPFDFGQRIMPALRERMQADILQGALSI